MTKTKSVPDSLDPDKIKSNLRTKRIGKKVVVYASTASTNNVAAEYAKNNTNDGLVVLAEEQISGRGRGGNRWVSNMPCSSAMVANEMVSNQNVALRSTPNASRVL